MAPDDAGAPEVGDTGTDTTADEAMTLEELAGRSGVAPRTIRYYQAEKLLQKPERDRHDARVARYGEAHLERLRLVGELRDRGLKLPAIRNLLQEGDASTRVSDWLGLDETLRGAWRQDAPRLLDSAELDELIHDAPPGARGQLEDAHLVVRQGDAWLLTNPGLLELTMGLVRDGVRLDLVLEAGDILQTHLSKAADELIELFVTALGQGFGKGADTSALVTALRPSTGDAARLIFGHQLERAIEALLADTKRLGKR